MAKSPLNFSLFGNLGKRNDRASEWNRFVEGLPDREREDLRRAFGSLSPQSQGKAPAWLNAFKQATPVERQGLNLLARAFGGSRLGILETLFNLIPGLRSQRVDVPQATVPGVRDILRRTPPSIGPRSAGRSGSRIEDLPPVRRPPVGPNRAGGGQKPPTGGGGFTTGPGSGSGGIVPTTKGGSGGGFTKPPVGPAGGSGDDEDLPFGEIIDDEEIGFGSIVPRPPKRAGKDGVWEQFPGFNRIPPPDQEERARRKEAGVAGKFGSVDMFEPRAASSNVHQVGYDPDERTLYVRFYPTVLVNGLAKKHRAGDGKGKGGQGPIYAYYNVPKAIFDYLLNANSPGKAVWDKLRVRGSRSAHQFGYSLAAEGLMWNRGRTAQIEYVPRRATADGFAPREFRGLDGRTVRNTLPATAPARGTPNRGEP